MTQRLTVGVEEEFHVVDPETRTLVNAAAEVLDGIEPIDGNAFEYEIKQTMVEVGTAVCDTLEDVRRNLGLVRGRLVKSAENAGRRVIASGTAPLGHWRDVALTADERYARIVDLHQQVVWEQVVCGCHVHVGFEDRELALQVLNRVRPWLAPLLALSTSSPYWLDHDTGYASYRTTIWWRWPTAHVPASFESVADYDDLVAKLVSTGIAIDDGQIYWDVRLSRNHPTLEFRVADTCTAIDEAVLHAALCRALATRAKMDAIADEPMPLVRPELLRAAKWRAARFGVTELLLDPIAGDSVPAATMVDRLLTYIHPVLEELGEWDEVAELAQRILSEGTSADRQRNRLARTGRLHDVVDGLIEETAAPAF